MILINRVTKLFNPQHSIFILLALSCLLLNCKFGKINNNQPTLEYLKDKDADQRPFKKVIILMHGLNCPEGLKILENNFKGSFSGQGYEIIRICRYNSCNLTVTQQADETYKKILSELNSRGINKKSPMMLLGSSHGGLVACELYNNYKTRLDIIGIVGDHTPWEGAPGVKPIDQHVINLEANIKSLGVLVPQLLGGLDLSKLSFKNALTVYLGACAGDDLDPNGEFITKIKSTLLDIDIPVLAIGGTVEPIHGLLELIQFFFQGTGISINLKQALMYIKNVSSSSNEASSLIAGLESQYTRIIGHTENDAFLPLSSQMAESIQNENITRLSITGYHHFFDIIAHEQVYASLIEYISNIFEKNIVNK